MANEIGTILIDVKADTAKLVSGMDKTQKYMQKTIGNMKNTVLGLATAYVSVQTAMKGFELAQQQASRMVQVAANFEKFDAVLRTIEGDSFKAKESLKWVQDFASVTPFNIDKVTSSFISLKSYGLEPTDGLLRTLGDTSAAMGKDIQQAVEAMADAVVGENERLKEFGIRASVAGETIKYSWTNASGEMRQTVIDNNSAMIESTLSAIFNSKYAGAMEEQSKTWNGLISNMEDNWTIFQKNLMDGGLFDYLKAIVTVVGEYMTTAFGNTLESSAIFSKYVIESIRSIILSMGSVYDSLETLGDYFSLVGDVASVAFYGIQTISSTVARGMWQSFEGVLNYIIDSFNAVIDLANSTGLFEFSFIGKVNFDVAALQAREDYVYQQLEQAKQDLSGTWEDLFSTGAGADFTQNLMNSIDEAYAKIQETPTITASKIDFGNAVEVNAVNSELVDYKVNLDNITNANEAMNDTVSETVSNVSDSFTDLSDTLYSDSGNDDVYTYVNYINESFNDLNDTSSKTVDAINEVSDALELFIFAFEDVFLNSIKTNISALTSVGQSAAFQTLSYEDALFNALTKRDELIANPLDISIGAQYKDAYDIFINAASDYLGNMSNFNSAQDYAFAQATVGSQASVFEDTAIQTVDVLESMNSFLETINQAFTDGILSDEEKATIAGVADVVNAKNEALLGSSSVVVAGLGAIPNTINAQEYYNNSGLATDANIDSQMYFNNSDVVAQIGATTYYDNGLLAKDASLNSVEQAVSGLELTGGSIDTTLLAKDASLVGTNSVSTAVSKLMGSASTGISLTSIASALPSLAVNTGLNVSDLSTIKTNTSTTNSNLGSVYSALGGSSSGGVGLDNLKIRAINSDVINQYTWFNGTNWATGTTPPSNAFQVSLIGQEGINTTYTYYAKGGFTGSGMGQVDETGERQAGIVHEGEWVAPKWMISQNPALFGALEMARLGNKSSIKASSPNVGSPSANQSNTDKYLFVLADEMKKMNSLLRRVTESGEAMKTKVVS